ncbi:MAG: phage major capsid protein [Candidatus Bipolaricaulis sp.]|nr:phage major capsid protein [Candidatus Bipolaricaulis sp.]
MAYNAVISATDAAALIPEEAASNIIKSVVDSSWLFSLSRRLSDMSRGQTRLPVMSALATAYFVTGETGLKQTSELNWANKYIDAEELAVIVPIAESVLDDSAYDIWGEVQPALVEAFNIAITGAVLYGTNIPATWTTNLGAAGLVAFATAATSVASVASFADLYEAILGESADGSADGLLSLLEADGFEATGHVGAMGMKSRLRNCRDADGNPIFVATPQAGTNYALDGAPCYFPKDGSISAASALLISGDWSQLVYSIRQDMTFKILDQAVIQDAAGNIVYNLAQQDMVAMRAVMRLGFALPNPINRMEQTEASRSPFAILTA